jgi:hypothetical protein
MRNVTAKLSLGESPRDNFKCTPNKDGCFILLTVYL